MKRLAIVNEQNRVAATTHLAKYSLISLIKHRHARHGLASLPASSAVSHRRIMPSTSSEAARGAIASARDPNPYHAHETQEITTAAHVIEDSTGTAAVQSNAAGGTHREGISAAAACNRPGYWPHVKTSHSASNANAGDGGEM